MGASTLNKKDLFRLHMREVEEDYAVLTRDCEYYISQTENLQDENTKLRKLVSCLLTCASYDCDCDRCPINGGSGIWQHESFCGELLDRMRELRIGVKE